MVVNCGCRNSQIGTVMIKYFLIHLILQLVNGRLKVLYNLGGSDGTSELSLDNAPASNGQWHNLLMRRIGKWFQLKMDGGEGRYYNESWGPEGGDQLISIKMYQIVAGGHVVFSSNPIVNGQDLNKSKLLHKYPFKITPLF